MDGVRGVVDIHTLLLAGTEATLIEVGTHHVLGQVLVGSTEKPLSARPTR